MRSASENRWHAPLRTSLSTLWGLYGFFGVAKNNDALAIKQLEWAMQKLATDELPTDANVEERVQSITKQV